MTGFATRKMSFSDELIGLFCSSKSECQILPFFNQALMQDSELRVQLELLDTGVWGLDEIVVLPSVRRSFGSHSPTILPQPLTNPASPRSEFEPSDVDAYFLAEIAMRRISHRCASSVHMRASGTFAYAPIVASELIHQLKEWYDHLPAAIKFPRDIQADLESMPGLLLFLQTQYYSCMTSIYWPAAAEVLKTGEMNHELKAGCEHFFQAYQNFMASVSSCVHHCPVNRWTLLGSAFAFTMAAFRAARDPIVSSSAPSSIYRSMSLAIPCFERFEGSSPSLTHLHGLLREHLQGLF